MGTVWEGPGGQQRGRRLAAQKVPWNMARILILKDEDLAGRGAVGRGHSPSSGRAAGTTHRQLGLRGQHFEGPLDRTWGRGSHPRLTPTTRAPLPAPRASGGGGQEKSCEQQRLDLIGPGKSASAPRVFKTVKIKLKAIRTYFLFQDISWSKMTKMSLSRDGAEAANRRPFVRWRGPTAQPARGTRDPPSPVEGIGSH